MFASSTNMYSKHTCVDAQMCLNSITECFNNRKLYLQFFDWVYFSKTQWSGWKYNFSSPRLFCSCVKRFYIVVIIDFLVFDWQMLMFSFANISRPCRCFVRWYWCQPVCAKDFGLFMNITKVLFSKSLVSLYAYY